MDEITVDRKTLKALGADTRVDILKNLSRRRMTQAELASALGMAASSVNEHLEQLLKADLVKQVDSGRKWKYYELTSKGIGLIQPSKVKIWFLLGISLIALAFSVTTIYAQLGTPVEFQQTTIIQQEQGVSEASQNLPEAAAIQTTSADVAEVLDTNEQERAVEFPQVIASQVNVETIEFLPLTSLPVLETLLAMFSILLVGLSIGLLKRD